MFSKKSYLINNYLLRNGHNNKAIFFLNSHANFFIKTSINQLKNINIKLYKNKLLHNVLMKMCLTVIKNIVTCNQSQK